jgi:hypothetical protein
VRQAEAACRSVYVLIDSSDEELRGFYTATRFEGRLDVKLVARVKIREGSIKGISLNLLRTSRILLVLTFSKMASIF